MAIDTAENEANKAAGRAIRRRREQRALTIADVQKATGIQANHLTAIEEGRLGDLPAGPYRKAYVQQVRGFLELDKPDPPRAAPTPEPEDPVQVAERVEAPADPDAPPASVPLWAVRAIATIAAIAMLALVVRQFTTQTLPEVEKHLPTVPSAPPDPADQKVAITVMQDAALKVTVDGVVAHDRRFAPGEKIEVEGRDSVEIAMPRAEAVKLRYNGVSVTPQGRQDEPRIVRFIDDVRAGK